MSGRKKISIFLFLAASGLAACSGTRPPNFAPASLGFGAVLIGARFTTPNGPTNTGGSELNFESENERYRLKFDPRGIAMLRVEPDIYRLHPQRGFFGGIEDALKLRIDGRSYRIPFPRSILRMNEIAVPPTKVVPIGILEARLLPIERGKEPVISIRLDDSIAARRSLVEGAIQKQMDRKSPLAVQDAAISWTRALEQALIAVQGEEERSLRYKPAR